MERRTVAPWPSDCCAASKILRMVREADMVGGGGGGGVGMVVAVLGGLGEGFQREESVAMRTLMISAIPSLERTERSAMTIEQMKTKRKVFIGGIYRRVQNQTK